MTKKTALYRHFDNEGRLLYVGISLDPIKRTGDHIARAHWAERICSISIEWLPSRGSAVDAEERAIVTEMPLHNVMGREPEAAPAIDEDAEMAKMERYLARGSNAALC